ncbi:glycosyltransferase family 4 protein [Desulfobulbus sp. N2]|nr:glycosyltransferase family 4 protein [Desulfobulbus sp. N2]
MERFSIVSQKYLLTVARFVPEKGLHDLIEAFTSLQGDCQLVIAGDADHETEYSSSIKEQAALDSRIILTGYLLGSELQQLFSHARLFVMASYHEGLPIAVLEAMSFLLPMIISSIQAHREIDINPTRYFLCGNPLELKMKIEQFFDVPLLPKELRQYRRQLRTKYNWKKIADKTISVYEQAIN